MALCTTAVASAVPRAAQAADCDQPYVVDKLLADLIAVEAALRGADDATAKATASSMAAGLGCLDTALPKQLVGRTYRAIGAGLVAGGNTAAGGGWFRTAAEIEQGYDYGVDELPPESPVRFAYMDAKGVSADVITLEGKELVEGQFKLDGRSLEVPEARPDRPHLLQRVDGTVVSWVFQGPEFPAEVVQEASTEDAVAVVDDPVNDAKGKPPKEPKAPKEGKAPKETKQAKAPKDKGDKEPKASKPAKVATTSNGQIKRKRPVEKTPLMIAGGVVLGAGGGLYYMASLRRGDFNDTNDMVEVDALQGQVNRLVVASAAVAAVGAGTLTWGIILDGGTALPAVRVRF